MSCFAVSALFQLTREKFTFDNIVNRQCSHVLFCVLPCSSFTLGLIWFGIPTAGPSHGIWPSQALARSTTYYLRTTPDQHLFLHRSWWRTDCFKLISGLMLISDDYYVSWQENAINVVTVTFSMMPLSSMVICAPN